MRARIRSRKLIALVCWTRCTFRPLQRKVRKAPVDSYIIACEAASIWTRLFGRGMLFFWAVCSPSHLCAGQQCLQMSAGTTVQKSVTIRELPKKDPWPLYDGTKYSATLRQLAVKAFLPYLPPPTSLGSASRAPCHTVNAVSSGMSRDTESSYGSIPSDQGIAAVQEAQSRRA